MTVKLFVTMLFAGIAAWAQGQSELRCPPTAMTGAQIETQIKAQVPESRITQFITTCHVGFGLRSAAFTHLKDSGASPAIVGAVRRDLYQRMSLKEAQDEVKVMGDDLRKTTAEIESRRDKELSALEGPYRQKRDALAQVPPQTKFQKDADYQALVRKSQDDVAALDRAHEGEKARVSARYAEEIRRAASENEALISTIKHQTYPVEGAALTFDDYDANNERLIAKVSGEIYWFLVPPEKAKDLYGRAAKAKVTRSLDEDALKTRALLDTVTGSTYSGYSKAAKEAADAEAKAEADRKAADAEAKLAAAKSEMDAAIAAAKKEDFAGARQRLDTACAGGIQEACAELAVLLSNQVAGPVDFVRARQLSVRACEAGVLNGCGHLGILYEDGEGGPVDVPRAVASYQKACDGGLQQACVQLGAMYAVGKAGGKTDFVRAAPLYKRACDGGDLAGCSALGRLYVSGSGVVKDLAKAESLFRASCGGGEAPGCTGLGDVYGTKEFALYNEATAASWFEKSCSMGAPDACYYTATRYANGLGVKKDLPHALRLYKDSCDQGFPSACNDLGVRYLDGKGVRKDEEEAVRLFSRACDGDDDLVCGNLGVHQYYGYGRVPANPTLGKANMQKSCRLGDKQICDALKTLR